MAIRGLVLSYQASLALMLKVDQWCERTGTNYNRLVTAAEVGVSTRSIVRNQGKCVSVAVASRLKMAMKRHKDGITLEEHRTRLAASKEPGLPVAEAPVQRVSRDPCARCGTRGDLECSCAPVTGGWLRV